MRYSILILSLCLFFVPVQSALATSYADSVVSFNPGPQNVAGTLALPNGILGAPDWNINLAIGSPPSSSDPYYQSYVNLGLGGELVVRMDTWLIEGAGFDLSIVEVGAIENVRAWVSDDLVTWIDLGIGLFSSGPVGSSTAWQFEFSGLVSGPVRYVKIQDNQTYPTLSGSDVDAVIGNHEVPEPTSLLLVSAGIGSLLMGKRRKQSRF